MGAVVGVVFLVGGILAINAILRALWSPFITRNGPPDEAARSLEDRTVRRRRGP